MNKMSPKNILVLKNRALGDSIIGLSAVQYLKSIYPDSNITYGVPRWVLPLYENVETACDSYLPIKLNGIFDWFKLWKSVSNNNYDVIVELHQGGRTGKFFSLYSKLKRIDYIYHNHNNIESERAPSIQRDLNGIYDALNIGEKPNYLNFAPEIKLKDQAEKKSSVVFGIVATRSTKIWPMKYFSELAFALAKNSPEIEIIIPISDSKFDQDLLEELKDIGLPDNAKMLKTSLDDLPRELVGSSLYIGNDTGLKHLCVALGIKTYTFFGPEEPFEWHPYDLNRHKYFFIEDMPCRTETSHFCGIEECDNHRCLEEIIPEIVLQSNYSAFL